LYVMLGLRRRWGSPSGRTGELVDDLATTVSAEVGDIAALDVLARALHVKNAELQPTLDAIVTTAVSTIPAASDAGLILVQHHELVPQSTTGSPPHLLDLLQQKTRSGPCLETAQSQTVTRVDNTASDARWPEFMAQAVSLGVGSMLCVPLWVDERTLGALSLYSDRPMSFHGQEEQTVSLFATLSALALVGAQRAAQLQSALRNREIIGQAKGILIERLRVTEDAAFVLLAQASQKQNQKLVAVAQHLVDTGELPGAAGSSRAPSQTRN
jgi:GAF domain-containing protein